MTRWRDMPQAELARLQGRIRQSAKLAKGAASALERRGAATGVASGSQERRQRPLIAELPLERDLLRACLAYLSLHPRVRFAFRANTGMVPIDDKRMFRAGFVGCSDILGMLDGGRFLAVEVKRPGKRPTTAQASFLYTVNAGGGLAFVATSVKDCEDALALLRR